MTVQISKDGKLQDKIFYVRRVEAGYRNVRLELDDRVIEIEDPGCIFVDE